MKTLYISRKPSVNSERSELKGKPVFNKHVFFPFRVTFCCILFLFSYATGVSQVVVTNKTTYFPGENVIVTGSVWQPGEAVNIEISKNGSPTVIYSTTAIADGNGQLLNSSFVVSSTEEETVYNLKADGVESAKEASTSFANKLGLAQSHNGGIGDTPISPVVWVNGNAHAQNSHYLEGNSIPYRVILKEVPTGIHTIRIKWDIKHGGKHALDFITSAKRLPAAGGISEVVDPTSDLPAGVFDNPTFFAIPTPATAMVVNGKPQPSTSFLALPAGDRMMAAYNATILSMNYLYEGNILDANSTTEIEISYQVVNGPHFVIFSWGGHIASRIDWGPGSSAASINGSPYHTALGISDHINGAQDRSLKTDAVQFFPSCELSALPPSCAGDTISITATTDAPSPQFTWNATNGAVIIGTGATVQVVVPQSGLYTVSVSIVDYFDNQVISETSNCSAEGSVLLDPVVSAGADQEQCLAIDGRDFEVTGSVSSGSFEWVVVSGTATIDSPNSLTTMVHLDANSNEVILKLQAIGSCIEQSDSLVLTVNIEPEVEIVTDDAPSCQDSTAEYSVAEISGYTYQWSISGDAQIDGSSTGSSVSVIMDNLCSVDYTLSVAVTDDNGCIGYDTLNVAFSDDEAPIISEGPGADTTIACTETPEFDPPSATDNCDAEPTLVQLDDETVQGNCTAEYSVTRSWYFIDDCGNISDTVSQTINVVDDEAPIISNGPGADTTIACTETPQFEAPSATDNCDAEPTLVQLDDETVQGNCAAEYSVTRSWYFIDDCGNISDTVSQTINVVDDEAPIISNGPGADTTIACTETPQFEAPSATDNCDAEPELVQLDDETVQGNCAAEYSVTRSWYFIDDCGNISDTVSQTINVVDDEAPIFTSGPGADATIACDAEPEFTAPIPSDNCSTIDLIASGPDTTYVDNEMVLTMTWYAMDACGNISDTVNQAITIQNCAADVFCSLTQGFYGNAKGVACATGERGRALMLRLLGADFGPMVIGSAGRSLTLNANNVDCLIGSMPAGGPASILPAGNASYSGNCDLLAGYHSGNGNNKKFKNVLLGQLITLGLNLRLDAELGGVQLEGNVMITYGAEKSTDGICGTDDDIMVYDDVLERSIPQSVLNALDAQYAGDRSIVNLYLLANRIIGGEVIFGVSLSNINQAVSAMNEGFDHCRFLGGFYSSREEVLETIELSTEKEVNYKVYPNPFSEGTTIEFIVNESMDVRIELYASNGSLVTVLFDELARGGAPYQVMLDGSMLQNGMYFCRIYANNQMFESKIILNK